MRFSSVKRLAASLPLLVSFAAGCRYIDVRRNVDGSWHAKYYSYGLWTSLGSLEVNVATNGLARLRMNDLGSDVSTNHVSIVDASGKVVAEITGEVVEHLVK